MIVIKVKTDKVIPKVLPLPNNQKRGGCGCGGAKK
jgi:hypothetical protein